MKYNDPTQLVQSVRTIYSLPANFHRINQAVDDINSSMDDIAEAILSDQSLATRLLKLANSSFYGFPSKIDTISHAVQMIGARQLRDLIYATSIIGVFEKIPANLVDMQSFWKHSIACGVIARLLAARRREPNTESFFLMGLVHDIGRLVLFQQMPDEAATIMLQVSEEHVLVYEKEKQILGFDHSDVGEALMNVWKLPPRMAESVRLHHRFHTNGRFPTESAIVHVTDVIVHALNIGSSGEKLVPPMHKDAWGRLDIPVEHISVLCKEAERQYTEMAQLLLPKK